MTKYPIERDCNNQLSGSQRLKGTSEPSQKARTISQAGWRGPWEATSQAPVHSLHPEAGSG